MEAAGYVDVTVEDISQDFLVTCRAWDAAAREHEIELRDHLGSAEFDQLHEEREAMAAAITDGVLQRWLISGVARSGG